MRARDNPFATERVLRIRYELPDNDWPGLFDRLDRLGYRVAIVGPHGAGKTTLLEDLEARLQARGVPTVSLRLDSSHRVFARETLDNCVASLTPAHVVCFDGAEQLTRFGWAAFQRRTRVARGVIVTSHRAGLLPTLIECRTTPHLLESIVSRLLAASPRPASLPTPNALFLKHRGNVREALRELYDWYAAA
jgi:hypothetical protein